MAKRRFTQAELEAYRGAPVDDLLPPSLRLLVVGINPGLWTAAANAHFARPGNRFWPALHRAGITRSQMDMSGGMSPEDAAELAAKLWVLPNPSGLNAHDTVDSLASAYRAAAAAAGLPLRPARE